MSKITDASLNEVWWSELVVSTRRRYSFHISSFCKDFVPILTVHGYIVIIIVIILQDTLELYKKNLIFALLIAPAGAEPRLIWCPQRPSEPFTHHIFAMISMTPGYAVIFKRLYSIVPLGHCTRWGAYRYDPGRPISFDKPWSPKRSNFHNTGFDASFGILSSLI